MVSYVQLLMSVPVAPFDRQSPGLKYHSFGSLSRISFLKGVSQKFGYAAWLT